MARVVERRGVVVELAGERDLVLGRCEFFLKLTDVGRGLEVGIRLDDDHHFAECGRELRLGGGTGLHVLRVESDRRFDGRIARGDHCLKGVFFEIHRPLHGIEQVGNQIVTALELDVDLLEGVGRLIPRGHEAVVGDDKPDTDGDQD